MKREKINEKENTTSINSKYDIIDNNRVTNKEDNDDNDKISILGYCWGGILHLFYTDQHILANLP